MNIGINHQKQAIKYCDKGYYSDKTYNYTDTIGKGRNA